MPNLVKCVLSFDDGSTQEFDAAPATPVAPAEVVDVTQGETIQVNETDNQSVAEQPAA